MNKLDEDWEVFGKQSKVQHLGHLHCAHLPKPIKDCFCHSAHLPKQYIKWKMDPVWNCTNSKVLNISVDFLHVFLKWFWSVRSKFLRFHFLPNYDTHTWRFGISFTNKFLPLSVALSIWLNALDAFSEDENAKKAAPVDWKKQKTVKINVTWTCYMNIIQILKWQIFSVSGARMSQNESNLYGG